MEAVAKRPAKKRRKPRASQSGKRIPFWKEEAERLESYGLDQLEVYVTERMAPLVECYKRAAKVYRDWGVALILAKEKTNHGKYQKWVKKVWGVHPRTALNYRDIAENWEKIVDARMDERDYSEILEFLNPKPDKKKEERPNSTDVADQLSAENPWLFNIRLEDREDWEALGDLIDGRKGFEEVRYLFGLERDRLRSCFDDFAVAGLAGKFYDSELGHIQIGKEDRDLYRPDGSLLLRFRKGVLDPSYWKMDGEVPVLKKAAVHTNNRPMACGGQDVFLSGMLGFRGKRPTKPTKDFQDSGDWEDAVLPFAQELNQLYEEHCPDHYEVQAEKAAKTPSEILIGETCFTSMTVNWNARCAAHADSGNLPGGLAAITVYTGDKWPGGLLVFPKYEVSVALETGDVLFADTRELHATGELVEGAERLVTISYFHKGNRPERKAND